MDYTFENMHLDRMSGAVASVYNGFLHIKFVNKETFKLDIDT